MTKISNEIKSTLVKAGWKKDFVEEGTPVLHISGWTDYNLSKKSDNVAWWKGPQETRSTGTLKGDTAAYVEFGQSNRKVTCQLCRDSGHHRFDTPEHVKSLQTWDRLVRALEGYCCQGLLQESRRLSEADPSPSETGEPYNWPRKVSSKTDTRSAALPFTSIGTRDSTSCPVPGTRAMPKALTRGVPDPYCQSLNWSYAGSLVLPEHSCTSSITIMPAS